MLGLGWVCEFSVGDGIDLLFIGRRNTIDMVKVGYYIGSLPILISFGRFKFK